MSTTLILICVILAWAILLTLVLVWRLDSTALEILEKLERIDKSLNANKQPGIKKP